MRGKYLKPNHRTETIHHAIFVDTETDQIQLGAYEVGHILRQGMAAYTRWTPKSGWLTPEWCRFETVDEFWTWVEEKTKPRTKMYIFAHNTGFDLPVLDAFNWLPAHEWKPGKLVLEGPPTIMEMRKDTRTLCILDTLNWWRTPLKSLGKSLGLPKLDMPDQDAGQEEWDIYNRRDVEIIMVAIQRWCDFLREHDLGGFALTLAGQSLRSYRHRFMAHRILIDDNTKALECSRECYHGGRTEALYIGQAHGNFHLVDVNSMYPYVMRTREYPTELRWYTANTDVSDLKAMRRKYLICARVRCKIDTPAIPVVHEGKLIYPIGEFDAAVSSPQIDWLLKNGAITKVYDMSMYRHAHIFREYVDEIYNHRVAAKRAGNDVDSYMFKILLNSLYGKFGQRGMVFEKMYDDPDMSPASWREIDVDTGQTESFRRVMGQVMKLEKRPESGGSHPAIAAHVTAYASHYLFELMQEAGSGHVYYMDTDSLLVDEVGLSRLKRHLDDTRLGALADEGEYTDIEIWGAKDYHFGDKKRTKGVRATAEWVSGDEVLQEKWCGLKGQIRAGRLNLPTTQRVVKTLSRSYDKGTVTPSGWVQPLVFGGDAT